MCWNGQAVTQRPVTIPVVACVGFLAAAIAGVVGFSLVFPNALLDRLWQLNKPAARVFRAVGWPAGVFVWTMGVGAAVTTRGLLRRKVWALYVALAAFATDLCGDVVSFFLTRDALRSAAGVLVSGAFLYALTRPAVRRYFHASE